MDWLSPVCIVKQKEKNEIHPPASKHNDGGLFVSGRCVMLFRLRHSVKVLHCFARRRVFFAKGYPN